MEPFLTVTDNTALHFIGNPIFYTFVQSRFHTKIMETTK